MYIYIIRKMPQILSLYNEIRDYAESIISLRDVYYMKTS